MSRYREVGGGTWSCTVEEKGKEVGGGSREEGEEKEKVGGVNTCNPLSIKS